MYLLNISPTNVVNGKTHYEVWYDCKSSVSNLKIFGCIAYAHVSKKKREKLDNKSKKYIFIGYSSEIKGYRLYDPLTKKLEINRDIIFNEQNIWN